VIAELKSSATTFSLRAVSFGGGEELVLLAQARGGLVANGRVPVPPVLRGERIGEIPGPVGPPLDLAETNNPPPIPL
jgi:hypothetical protein